MKKTANISLTDEHNKIAGDIITENFVLYKSLLEMRLTSESENQRDSLSTPFSKVLKYKSYIEQGWKLLAL